MGRKKQHVVDYGVHGAALQQALASLNEAAAELSQRIRAESLQAVCWRLNRLSDTETEVEVLSGVPARIEAAAVYADFYPGEDILYARRLPGLIEASSETLAAAGRLNEAKVVLKAVMQQIPTQEDRQAIVRQVAPSLHFVQCYRAVPVLAQAPERASFIWSVGENAITRLDDKRLKALLAKARERCLALPTQESCLTALRVAERVLAGHNPATLVHIRPIAPHPKVSFLMREAPIQRSQNASLPALYPSTPGMVPRVHPLKRLDLKTIRERPRAARSDRRYDRESPLVASLHIYSTSAGP